MKAAKNINKLSSYYFEKKLSEIRSLKSEGKKIINLGIGSPDMKEHPEIIRELWKHSTQKESNQYQAYNGLKELRQAFSNWYQRIYNVRLNPETELLPLMGSKEAIMHIHLAFCDSEDEILIPNPAYPAYQATATILGLKVRHYDLHEHNDWLPDMEALEQLDTRKIKVMWLNYPSMPMGKVADKTVLKTLLQFAKRRGILLVNDNPYSLILNKKPLSIHSVKEDYEDVLELNSLSKSHNMAGWRLGLVSGSKSNIEHILKVKSNFDSGMYKPIQMAAVKALELEDSWYQQLNSSYAKRREIIYQLLDALSCSYTKNTSGLFVWARIPQHYKSSESFADMLLYDKNIFATPGSVFGTNGKHYIRFSLCAEESLLEEALKRVQQKSAVCSASH